MFDKLMVSDGANGDYFGYNVTITPDGSTIVVSSHRDDDKGTAYVY